MIPARLSAAVGESVWTSMPSAAGMVQEVASLGQPLISTMHMRQVATGGKSRVVAIVGDIDAHLLAGIQEQGSRLHRDFLIIDLQLGHGSFRLPRMRFKPVGTARLSRLSGGRDRRVPAELQEIVELG